MIKLQKGHYYRIKAVGFTNKEYIVEYMGRQKGWSCIICGKGNNAKTFNVFGYPKDTIEQAVENYNNGEYETWGFGDEHLPEILEELNIVR